MSEEKILSVIRDLAEAYVKRDVEKMLSFFTEDVVWAQPEGTFKGKEEVKLFLAWDAAQRTPDFKARDAGIGIMMKGNKAVYECVFEGSTPDGRGYREIPGITVYEFSGERIQQVRLYNDRLLMGKQAAKGWFERMIMGRIMNRFEKGLH